jgi:hypothetical protein
MFEHQAPVDQGSWILSRNLTTWATLVIPGPATSCPDPYPKSA